MSAIKVSVSVHVWMYKNTVMQLCVCEQVNIFVYNQLPKRKENLTILQNANIVYFAITHYHLMISVF